MLELDTTIMTPSPVFETSGHVARFADWMVKDLKTGDVLRADHLVKNVLQTRLEGDKEARGAAAQPMADEKDKKKKKKDKSKPVVVQLPDMVVPEYERILAQVSTPYLLLKTSQIKNASFQLDNYSGPELGQLMREHKIHNPDTDNEVSEPVQFNLMFTSSIGPTGQHPGYVSMYRQAFRFVIHGGV